MFPLLLHRKSAQEAYGVQLICNRLKMLSNQYQKGRKVMKDYGLVRSTIKPQEVEIKQTKVFVTSNIRQFTFTIEDEEVTEYEFNLVEYDKDDYIKMMIDRNTKLEQTVTNTQIGLCEVYEKLE